MARNFILLSGGPGLYDPRDLEHDVSWANYVTHPLQQTQTREQRRRFKAVDEEVWWLIFRPAYERRWSDDQRRSERRYATIDVNMKDCGGRNCRSYIDLLEFRARERGWNLRWFDSAADFWHRLASFSDPISRLYYWGHARNDLWLSLRHDSAGRAIAPNSNEIIRVSDIARNSSLRSRFQMGSRSRYHIFRGCNTHTFAREWARIFRVYTRGYEGTLSFRTLSSTGRPTPAQGCTLRGYRPVSSTDVAAETTSHKELLEEISYSPGSLEADEFYREIAFRPNRNLLRWIDEHFIRLGHPGELLEIFPQMGDLLIRSVPFEGIFHSGVIISEHTESASDLASRGVLVEWAGAGTYVEVLEVSSNRGLVVSVGRRMTDPWGRLLRGQMVLRSSSSHTNSSS